MKKIILVFVFTLLSLVMISCEGELSGLTLPDGLTTDPPQTTLDNQTQITTDLQTSIPTTDGGTQHPSTSDLPTSQIPTSTETTTSQVTTEEPTSNPATTTEEPTTQPTTTQEPTTTEAPTTEDRTSEINNLRLVMQNSEMDVTDELAFASELYDQGMKANDLTDMMANVSTVMAISPEADMTDVYTIVDLVMEDMDREMMHAMVAALVKVELRNNLQAQIDSIVTLSLSETMTEEEIHMIESMIDFIDLYGDDAVDSVMMVIEYIMDIQALIEPSYIQNIETLSIKETYSSIDLNLMVMVKNGFVGGFKNALPSQQDFMLLNATIINFVDILTEESFDFDPLKVDKQASMQRMSLELFYDFLLDIDVDFVTALYELSQNSEDSAKIKVFAREVLDLIDGFTEDYAADIQAIEDVMTDEEKKALFETLLIDQLLAHILSYEMDQTMINSILAIIDTYIEYETLDDMSLIIRNIGDDLIDSIITNDYALVDALIDISLINEEDYTTIEDYDTAMQSQIIMLIDEALNVLNPIVQDGTIDEYTVVLDLVMDAIGFQIEMQALMESIDMTDQMTLYAIIGSSIYNTKTSQFAIMQNTVNFVTTTDYLDTIYPILTQMNQTPSEETMAQFGIELANAFIDYHTLISSDIDILETEISSLTTNTTFISLTGMTQTEIDEINDIFDEIIPSIHSQASLIKDYDYTDLTIQELANVQIFLSFFFNEGDEPTN